MDNLKNHPFYREHTLDSVMNSLLNFYKSRFLALFLSSFVFSLATQFVASTINLNEIQGITDLHEVLDKFRQLIPEFAGIMAISILVTVLLHYYIIHSPVDSNITILNSFSKSLKYFLPYLAVILVLAVAGAVAMVLGLLIFIIGIFFAMLYIMTLSLFILPVLILEDTNIPDAISRVFTLAHRRFWYNIGWVAVFLIIIIVISIVGSAIIMIPFTGSFLKEAMNPGEAGTIMSISSNPVYILLTSLFSALYLPVMPLLGSILYFNGKAREDNVPASDAGNEPYKVRVEDLYAKPLPDESTRNDGKNRE
jgi:hypothetical protein